MISLTLLMLWVSSGVAIAAAAARPGEPRWGWAPVAAFLGPLWAVVAHERR